MYVENNHAENFRESNESHPVWVLTLHYLRGFNPEQYDYVAPAELTQPGIAAAIGTSRAYATQVLNRLLDDGYVERRLVYIVNGQRRKYIYVLTCDGLRIARKV